MIGINYEPTRPLRDILTDYNTSWSAPSTPRSMRAASNG